MPRTDWMEPPAEVADFFRDESWAASNPQGLNLAFGLFTYANEVGAQRPLSEIYRDLAREYEMTRPKDIVIYLFPGLDDHIAKMHLDPDVILWYGVPLYDLMNAHRSERNLKATGSTALAILNGDVPETRLEDKSLILDDNGNLAINADEVSTSAGENYPEGVDPNDLYYDYVAATLHCAIELGLVDLKVQTIPPQYRERTFNPDLHVFGRPIKEHQDDSFLTEVLERYREATQND